MQKKKIMRGFAIMSQEKLRAVQSAGGKSTNARGLAHKWTKEEASSAGKRSAATRWGWKPPSEKKLRGLASMDREKLHAVTSAGGKVAHALGRAHTWTPEEASNGGKKGGAKSKRPKRSRL